MGQAYRIDGPWTETAGEALEGDRLVKLSAGTVVYADAGDEPIGISQEEPVLSGENVTVWPLRGQVERVTGAGVIASGTGIYAAADGKVSDAAVGKQIGILRTAVTAANGKAAAIMWGPRGGNDMLQSKLTVHEYIDDFEDYDPTATVGGYAAVTDGGAVAQSDAAGGVLSIATGATLNDETYISSIAENWLFKTDKRLFFEALVALTEANVNTANIIVGLSNVVAANTLVDGSAGPVVSFDGACFYKVGASLLWRFITSNAAVQVLNANLGTYASNTWYRLGFLYDPNDGVTAKVTPFLNGIAGTAHDLTIAGLEEMHILLGVKNGSAHAETLRVDAVRVVTER